MLYSLFYVEKFEDMVVKYENKRLFRDYKNFK